MIKKELFVANNVGRENQGALRDFVLEWSKLVAKLHGFLFLKKLPDIHN